MKTVEWKGIGFLRGLEGWEPGGDVGSGDGGDW